MDAPPIEDFNRIHDLRFSDLGLLQQVFVHRSYINEINPVEATLADNERLEFLGDSVLGFVVADLLYRSYPTAQEGDLTHLRTSFVRRETLARIADEMQIGRWLLLGVGEEESGGRTRVANLCDAFEALAAAIYLDQGLEGVQRILAPMINARLLFNNPSISLKDPKSRYQEWAQSTMNLTPRYRIADSFGPDHAKTFVSLVTVKGKQVGVGQGHSKQDAEQAAAALALHRCGQPAPEYQPHPELEQKYGLGGSEAQE
jgi:ribonuclease-3